MTAGKFDWSRHVVDHLDAHATDFGESVRFYETVLAPLAIPKWSQSEGKACFNRVNIVDRKPATRDLHLCFVARSREEVDAFDRTSVADVADVPVEGLDVVSVRIEEIGGVVPRGVVAVAGLAVRRKTGFDDG